MERFAGGADVVVAANYGEAAALELFGRGLPQLASDHALLAARRNRTPRAARWLRLRGADFCTNFRLVAHISTPHGSNERGEPIARCTLDRTLAHVWPQIIATSDYTRY